MSEELTYPVMFTEPGNDNRGAPRGAALIRALADEPVQEDGYSYAALGPETRAELARMTSSLGFRREDADDIAMVARSIRFDHSEGVNTIAYSVAPRLENIAQRIALLLPSEVRVSTEGGDGLEHSPRAGVL